MTATDPNPTHRSEPSAAPRVLLVGAGGLGAPVALLLAGWIQRRQAQGGTAARLTLLDDDRVELSNLHRQLLHDDATLGWRKVDSARRRLAPLDIDIVAERLAPANAQELCAGHALLIDGSDSIDTKFLVSDSAARLGVPAVIGGVVRWAGQVMTVAPGSACYRCLFEEPPAEAPPSCQAVGVLGPACGVIGALQAEEAIRLLSGQPPRYAGHVLVAELDRGRYRRVQVGRRRDCPGCLPRS